MAPGRRGRVVIVIVAGRTGGLGRVVGPVAAAAVIVGRAGRRRGLGGLGRSGVPVGSAVPVASAVAVGSVDAVGAAVGSSVALTTAGAGVARRTGEPVGGEGHAGHHEHGHGGHAQASGHSDTRSHLVDLLGVSGHSTGLLLP